MNKFITQADSRAIYVALCKIICPACDHELQHHLDKYGCEVERGDREGDESGPATALPPCGCNEGDGDLEEYPDIVRAIEAIRKVRT